MKLNLFNKPTETVEFNAVGTYFEKNVSKIKRTLNPEFKDGSVRGLVFKYSDVSVPIKIELIPNDYDRTALVLVSKFGPIGYVRPEDKPKVRKLLKTMVSGTATLSGGEYRVDSDCFGESSIDIDYSITFTK